MTLTLEGLTGITDTVLRAFVMEEFKRMLIVNSSVKDLMDQVPAVSCTPCNRAFVEKVMAALFADRISTIKDVYGFHDSIENADQAWKTALQNSASNTDAIAEAQNIYHSRYCDMAQNQAQQVSFRNYVQDTQENWKETYEAYLKTNEFIQELWGKCEINVAEFWSCANGSLYKLARLEKNERPSAAAPSAAVGRVVDCWKSTGATLPKGFQWEELKNFSWLLRQQFSLVAGNIQPDDWFTNLLDSNICRWQAGYRIKTESSYGSGYASSVQLEVHGEPILNWLKSSGKTYFTKPDRVYNETRHHTGSGEHSCFIAGTQILLADGCEASIETLHKGDTLRTAFGGSAVYTGICVVSHLQREHLLYGMELANETGQNCRIEPFVTAGHMFMTDHGWKAVVPEIAKEENPFCKAGRLVPGDFLYRMKEDGSGYETLRLLGLLSRQAYEGETVYDVHIADGQANYHANRFLVAFNYPVYTVRRLSESFEPVLAAHGMQPRQVNEVLQEMNAWMGGYE